MQCGPFLSRPCQLEALYIYIYIYPPAPACQGPPGCEAGRVKSEVNVILSFIDISYFKYSSNIPSAITIWWSTGQQTGVWQSRGQQAGDIDLLLDAPGAPIYPPAPRFTQLGEVLKINEISMHIQYTNKSRKWCPRTSQSHQMRSQEVPKVVKITKILKKWNLMKTSVFSILLKG